MRWNVNRRGRQRDLPIRYPTQSPAADPIAWHPAVRRRLWTLKARTEAARVLAAGAARALDEHASAADPVLRAAAGERATLLTPVVKALLTDLGHHGADQALAADATRDTELPWRAADAFWMALGEAMLACA